MGHGPCRGFTLIEVVLSLGVITVAFGGIAVFAGRVVGAANTARQDLVAAQLATEGVEIIRNLRETNWINGRIADCAGTGPCLFDSWRTGLANTMGNKGYIVSIDTQYNTIKKEQPPFMYVNQPQTIPLLLLQPDGTYGYDSGEPTPFRRYVQLSPGGAAALTTMEVTSVVLWCPTATQTCTNERPLIVVDRLRNWIPQQ